MAGINRLGKAPPKPGTLRPPDPNKYRAVDFYSQDAEGDADYMRMVRDIESSQQQHGWLFGRGAFDKSDLLFLRDEEEKRRQQELQRRTQERQQFAVLKAKAEADLRQPTKEQVQLGKRTREDTFMKPNALRVKVKDKDKGKKETSPNSETVPLGATRIINGGVNVNYEGGLQNPMKGLVDCYGSDEEESSEEEQRDIVSLPDPVKLLGGVCDVGEAFQSVSATPPDVVEKDKSSGEESDEGEGSE